MATIGEAELRDAIRRLGELAMAEASDLNLLLLGGAVMVLAFGARQSTRDLDVVFLPPTDPNTARRLAATVALERGMAGGLAE